MIGTIGSISPAIQVLGLLGALLGLSVTLVFGERYTLFYGAGAVIAVFLDVAAIRLAPRALAIGASLLKVAAVVMTSFVLVMGPANFGPPPLLPPSTGLLILLYSSVPSVIGAILRRALR